MQVTMVGIYTPGGTEDRDILYLNVEYENSSYDWAIYYPHDTGMDIPTWIAYNKTAIESDLVFKRTQWENLEPKITTTVNEFGDEETHEILASEIIRPEIPDYYAKRRAEYPPMNEQLGAIGKGVNSDEYKAILQKIEEVKAKYPKPVDTVKPVETATHKVVWSTNLLEWILEEKTAQDLLAERVVYWSTRKLNRIQFEFMIKKLGLESTIGAAIASMPESTEEEINTKLMASVLFTSGQSFERLHPLFSVLAPAVNLTDEQLDAIWLQALTV